MKNTSIIIPILLIVDSLHFVFAKLLLPHISPNISAMWVLLVATLEVGIYGLYTKQISWREISKQWKFFLAIGFLVAASTNINYEAVAFIDPGSALVLDPRPSQGASRRGDDDGIYRDRLGRGVGVGVLRRTGRGIRARGDGLAGRGADAADAALTARSADWTIASRHFSPVSTLQTQVVASLQQRPGEKWRLGLSSDRVTTRQHEFEP